MKKRNLLPSHRGSPVARIIDLRPEPRLLGFLPGVRRRGDLINCTGAAGWSWAGSPFDPMHYRQRNYWPLLHLAAALSGLVALGTAGLLVNAVLHADSIGGNPALLFVLLGLGLVLSAGGCIGVFMKRWWGRGILTFVAVLYLLAFPIGTILGFFVLKGLSVHKNEFR